MMSGGTKQGGLLSSDRIGNVLLVAAHVEVAADAQGHLGREVPLQRRLKLQQLIELTGLLFPGL
jgi:hypothetical protein